MNDGQTRAAGGSPRVLPSLYSMGCSSPCPSQGLGREPSPRPGWDLYAPSPVAENADGALQGTAQCGRVRAGHGEGRPRALLSRADMCMPTAGRGMGGHGGRFWLEVPQAGHLQPRVDSCPPCLRPWWPWTLDTAPRAGGPAGPVQHRGERPEQPGWGAASSGSLSSGSRKHGGSGEAELEAGLGPGLRAGEPWSTPPCAEVLAAPWEGSPGAR